MTKKLQIFISSTYTDLIEERQAAVEAILRAGHIPAGMELFAAGDKTQKDTIKNWIDESDIFMLILGSRYGSLDPETNLSYTHIEYNYATEKDKRLFAVVLSDKAIDEKVAKVGKGVVEVENHSKYVEFKRTVKSKICRIVDDPKDIKLAIHETILDYLRKYEFSGWISGKAVKDTTDLAAEITRLSKENAALKKKADELQTATKSAPAKLDEFRPILQALNNEKITFNPNTDESRSHTAAEWFLLYSSLFVSGVTNHIETSKFETFLYHRVAPKLIVFGLTEIQQNPKAQWSTIRTTKKGNELLASLSLDTVLNPIPQKTPPLRHDAAPAPAPARKTKQDLPKTATKDSSKRKPKS